MIDIHSETVISLADAPRHLPKRRGGKRPHIATLYRWAQRGCRGMKLETVQVGGTLCTSLEALQRFCDRLTSGVVPTAAPEPAGQQSTQVTQAKRAADTLGI